MIKNMLYFILINAIYYVGYLMVFTTNMLFLKMQI